MDTKPIYTYPVDLVNKPIPKVFFTCKTDITRNKNITLCAFPVPAGLTFSDSAVYTNVSLGSIGQLFLESGSVNEFKQKANKALNKQTASDAIMKKFLEGVADTNIPVVSDIAKAQQIKNRQVFNPNINTSFQNVEPRNFDFSFKMAARTRAQAKEIQQIVKFFRTNTYPTGSELLLNYPSLWEIAFVDGEGNENKFLPKIYDCYLISTNVVYNESSNMFHDDGSPTQTSVQLSFREADTRTADEIYTDN